MIKNTKIAIPKLILLTNKIPEKPPPTYREMREQKAASSNENRSLLYTVSVINSMTIRK